MRKNENQIHKFHSFDSKQRFNPLLIQLITHDHFFVSVYSILLVLLSCPQKMIWYRKSALSSSDIKKL